MRNVSDSRREDVDLLFLLKGRTGQQGQELLLAFSHRPYQVEMRQVMAQRRAELDMYQVGEASAGQHTLVALDIEISMLCGTRHMIRREPYLFLFRRPLAMKKMFATIQPW